MRAKQQLSFLVIIVLMLTSFPAFAAEDTMTSLEGRWSYSVINKWLEAGSIEGSATPDAKVTGLELQMLISNIAGINIRVSSMNNYVTREEAAIALSNALMVSTESTALSYTDSSELSGTGIAAVAALNTMDVMRGYPDGSFMPNKELTFEEAVALADQLTTKDLIYTKGTTQTTRYGVVDGITLNNDQSLAWLGVPYAAKPINELRWRAPQKPEPWEGILATKEFTDKAIQLSFGNLLGSEDCLYMNIYRPNTDEKDLPVLVFVHGGNNQSGTSQDFQGEVLADNTNSIIISIDYRLTALGWVNLPALKTGDPLEDSGNFGLLDIHESLIWVNENIKAFGGDPYNVTISGQSAGGRDVMAMLISPVFKGDFQKAFAISGGMTVADPAEGQAIAAKAFSALVLEDGLVATEEEAITWLNTDDQAVEDYLRSLPAERIAPLMSNAAIRMSVFPHLFADGTVLPSNGFDVLATGDYNKVPVILGSCETEFSLFAATDGMFTGSFFGGTLETDEVLLPQYKFASTYGSMLYTGFNADRSAEIMADIDGQPSVYAYRFAWGQDTTILTPGWGMLLGAFHGIDMDFLKGREDSFVQTNYTEENKPGREELTAIIHSYLKNFLHTGNPNSSGMTSWEPWTNGTGAPKLMVFDADAGEANVGMTSTYINDTLVFEAMDFDNTITAEEKRNLISTVLSGRFFSETLDTRYNQQ